MNLKTFKQFVKLGYRVEEIAQCEAVFILNWEDINYEALQGDEELSTILDEASDGVPSERVYHDEEPTFDIYNKENNKIMFGVSLTEVEEFIEETIDRASTRDKANR